MQKRAEKPQLFFPLYIIVKITQRRRLRIEEVDVVIIVF